MSFEFGSAIFITIFIIAIGVFFVWAITSKIQNRSWLNDIQKERYGLDGNANPITKYSECE